MAGLDPAILYRGDQKDRRVKPGDGEKKMSSVECCAAQYCLHRKIKPMSAV
jgi:hypothetical protein